MVLAATAVPALLDELVPLARLLDRPLRRRKNNDNDNDKTSSERTATKATQDLKLCVRDC